MKTNTLRKDNKIDSYQIYEKPVLSELVQKLKNSFINTDIKTSIKRAEALHDAYLESGGESIILTRARVLDRYLRKMTIYIDENPIVGSLAKYRRAVNPFPDYNEAANKLLSSFGNMEVDQKEKKYSSG